MAEIQKHGLIVGASRGLGLGLALELLKRGWRVTATVRSAAGGTGLEAFHEHVSMDTLDINDAAQEAAFLERQKGEIFDVAFINAGISPKDNTVETAKPADIAHLFMTNAVSPARLGAKLLPLVRHGGILAFMSSILGSVELSRGSWPLYSASKAALNSLTGGIAALPEARHVTVLNVHPGWVRTDMGGANADIDVETSVSGIADVLDAKMGRGVHEFVDYKGDILPW
jgi:NAD(P)-dependent dehydrogenase (short-subunit alcohol dehydrogenase family)